MKLLWNIAYRRTDLCSSGKIRLEVLCVEKWLPSCGLTWYTAYYLSHSYAI